MFDALTSRCILTPPIDTECSLSFDELFGIDVSQCVGVLEIVTQ